MAIIRTINCGACGYSDTELEANAGFIGWGALQGIELNGEANPTLCPACLNMAADVLDKIGVDHGMD